MLGPGRPRVPPLWACALLGCLSAARDIAQSAALTAAIGCLHRGHATEGVDKQIVDSALVFDGGAVATGLESDDPAVQCLRAAIAAVLTTGNCTVLGLAGCPFVSRLKATAYTDSGGEQDSKVTFSVSMYGIDAQTVLDELTNAAVETTNMMAELTSCAWPFGDIDAEETDHVLLTETFQRATVATVGAVVSSALVFDGFTADSFNADSVAVEKFKDVAAGILGASLIQIDNILAEDFNHLNAARSGSVERGATIRFDLAVHAWPINAVVLETPEAVAEVMLDALAPVCSITTGTTCSADADCPTGETCTDGLAAGLLLGFASTCDCVLAAGVLHVEASKEKIDIQTLGGTHVVTSPPVPCANCGGGGDDDDDDLDAGARIAIALAAVFCFLGGVLATMLYISRMNKFNGCLSSAKRRIGAFTGSADLELRPVDPTHKDEVRPAGVVLEPAAGTV